MWGKKKRLKGILKKLKAFTFFTLWWIRTKSLIIIWFRRTNNQTDRLLKAVITLPLCERSQSVVIASKIAKNHSSFIWESIPYLTNILFCVSYATPFRFLLHRVFWMRWRLRRWIFMGDGLGSDVTLNCLGQSHVLSFTGWLDTPTLFSDLNAWIVVVWCWA